MEILTGPSSGSGTAWSFGSGRFGLYGVRSGSEPFRMWIRSVNGSETASPHAAQISAIFTELRWAIAPQTTDPSASPPWNVIRYSPSARACTHRGTDNCTLTFSVDIVLVQQNPAPSSAGITAHGDCTSAITTSAAM